MKNLKTLFVFLIISLFAISCGSESEDPQPQHNDDENVITEAEKHSNFIGNFKIETVTINDDFYNSKDEFCASYNSETKHLFEFDIREDDDVLFYDRYVICQGNDYVDNYVGEIDIDDEVIKFYRKTDNKDTIYNGNILEKTSNSLTVEWLHVTYGKPIVKYSISN